MFFEAKYSSEERMEELRFSSERTLLATHGPFSYVQPLIPPLTVSQLPLCMTGTRGLSLGLDQKAPRGVQWGAAGVPRWASSRCWQTGSPRRSAGTTLGRR